MPFRFRPFGVLGSTLEVLVGLLVVRSALWTDEDYPGWSTAAFVVIGAVLLGAGAIGLAAAARRALGARGDRDRDANAA
jgi:hypothetical protein